MVINLRGISEELHQALRVRAVEERVTLQSLCVRFLWQGLETIAVPETTDPEFSDLGPKADSVTVRVEEESLPARTARAMKALTSVALPIAPPVEEEKAWPLCVACEGKLMPTKGKWACPDTSCAKYGVEQKVRAA